MRCWDSTCGINDAESEPKVPEVIASTCLLTSCTFLTFCTRNDFISLLEYQLEDSSSVGSMRQMCAIGLKCTAFLCDLLLHVIVGGTKFMSDSYYGTYCKDCVSRAMNEKQVQGV